MRIFSDPAPGLLGYWLAIAIFSVACQPTQDDTETTSTLAMDLSALTDETVLRTTGNRLGPIVRNFNPFVENSRGETLGLIYEPLIRLNAISGEFEPYLAESFTQSDDLRSITITLPDDIQWSDGKPLTSDDVIFTFELLKSCPACDLRNVSRRFTEIRALDDRRVEFELRETDVNGPFYLAGGVVVVPKHVWQSIDEPFKVRNENPIGSGPFLLVDDRFGTQAYTLAKNPDYYRPGEPHIEGIQVISFISNIAAELDIKKGKLDWGSVFFQDIEQGYVAQSPEYHKYWFPPGNPVYLVFNLNEPPFSDLALRRALALAIDKEELTQTSLNGYAKAAPSHGLKESNRAVWPAGDEPLTPNIDAARKLLKEAGFDDEKRLEVELIVPAGWSDWISASNLLTHQLNKVYIEVKLRQVNWGSMQELLQTGDYELALAPVTYHSMPYFYYYYYLHSLMVGKSNRTRIADDDIDAWLDAYRTEPDVSLRQAILRNISTRVRDDVLGIPLWFNPVWFQYHAGRFDGWPTEENQYALPRPGTIESAVIARQLKPTLKAE